SSKNEGSSPVMASSAAARSSDTQDDNLPNGLQTGRDSSPSRHLAFVTNLLNAPSESFASQGRDEGEEFTRSVESFVIADADSRGVSTRFTDRLARAQAFARGMLPKILQRGSSSSMISPFEFDEEDFPSGISNQSYGNESSVERSANAET
ncbi:hypothetical protein FOZ63_022157, partial [Perkinsus olseni]